MKTRPSHLKRKIAPLATGLLPLLIRPIVRGKMPRQHPRPVARASLTLIVSEYISKKALDVRRSMALICASDIPLAACLVAPMRKLWPLYLDGSRPQNLGVVESFSVKVDQGTREPLGI